MRPCLNTSTCVVSAECGVRFVLLCESRFAALGCVQLYSSAGKLMRCGQGVWQTHACLCACMCTCVPVYAFFHVHVCVLV